MLFIKELSPVFNNIARVAGGISRAGAFVCGNEVVNAISKAVRGLVKRWVELPPAQIRRAFFELCVHQCTRISDWLRVLKRQSTVNLYFSSFPGEKVFFIQRFAKWRMWRNAQRKLWILWIYAGKAEELYKRKNRKEPLKSWFRGTICKMGLISLHDFETLYGFGSWHLYISRSLLGH